MGGKTCNNETKIKEETEMICPFEKIAMDIAKKPFKRTKAEEKKHQENVRKYPWSFTVYITTGSASKRELVRNEIEKKWEKFGDWVGHGYSYQTGEYDVQVAFKTKPDVDKARKLAVNSMFKHGVSGRYSIYNELKEKRK
jgi:hypothetical protein